MSGSARLTLDHLTVTDTTPAELARVAAETGCAGICFFLKAMPILSAMPAFDLVADAGARRETRARCRDLGIAIDLVYPFTLSRHVAADDLIASLDAAAELGAEGVNVLAYERDDSRRRDLFAEFCVLARARGLKVAVEFYPPSQVATLEAGLALVEGAGPADAVGLTVDLLHLMRSGGAVADLSRVPAERIHVAQLCDGPARMDRTQIEAEAAQSRLLPEDGDFDVAGFIRALPAAARLTVEVPRDVDIGRGVPVLDRARAAVAASRRAILAAHAPR